MSLNAIVMTVISSKQASMARAFIPGLGAFVTISSTMFYYWLATTVDSTYAYMPLEWAFSLPLITVQILTLSNLSLHAILYIIGVEELFVVSSFLGAINRTPYRWGWFALSLIFWLSFGIAAYQATPNREVSMLYFRVLPAYYVALSIYPFLWFFRDRIDILILVPAIAVIDMIVRLGLNGFLYSQLILYDHDLLEIVEVADREPLVDTPNPSGPSAI
ncbi:hypothetical protein BC833DRAFT_621790 [Globomyces pollinis-pini]|nr:hypothetical protein BC833DRAFT_621790 [Globomyces pollinis-pini]